MGPERWREVERTVNRLALAFEPVMAPRGEGTLKTQFDVGLYAYSLVSLGEGPYQDALARGDAAGADATEADIQRGLFLLGIFWTDVLLTHARKARWRRLTMGTIAVEPPVYLPGFVRRMPLVEECFMKVRGGGTTSQVSPTFSKMRNMKKSGSTSLGR
jgi:hypothetical protein